jgi:hypothetical protein
LTQKQLVSNETDITRDVEPELNENTIDSAASAAAGKIRSPRMDGFSSCGKRISVTAHGKGRINLAVGFQSVLLF